MPRLPSIRRMALQVSLSSPVFGGSDRSEKVLRLIAGDGRQNLPQFEPG